MIHVDVSRRRLLALFATLATLGLIAIAGAYVALRFPPDGHWLAHETVMQFALTAENRVAVWYSSMLLLSVAVAMAGCWLLDRREGGGGAGRVLDLGWLLFAGVFALLSLDELGSLHERLSYDLLPKVHGLYGWTAFLLLPIALVALLMIGFAWARLRRRPLSAAFMVLGALLFVSVPLQEQPEAATWGGERSPLLSVLEEGTELFGALAFLAAALVYAAGKARGREDGRRLAFDLRPGAVALVVALLAAGFAWAVVVLPEVLALDDHRGVPQNWFAAAAAFLAALLAFSLSGRAGHDGTTASRRALLLLGAVLLVLSADHGAAHHLSETLIAGNAPRRLLLDVLLAAGLLATAALVVLAVPHRPLRLAVALWAAAEVLAFLPVVPARVVPAFAAYVLLLLALVGLAREAVPGAPDERRPLARRGDVTLPRSPSRAGRTPPPRAARRA